MLGAAIRAGRGPLVRLCQPDDESHALRVDLRSTYGVCNSSTDAERVSRRPLPSAAAHAALRALREPSLDKKLRARFPLQGLLER
jgi:hypothetical protein